MVLERRSEQQSALRFLSPLRSGPYPGMSSPLADPAARWLRRSTAALMLLALALPVRAALRTPQVPVSGTALQSFFTGHGQAIDVNTAQQDLQRVSLPSGVGFQVSSFGAGSFGAYNAGLIAPPLYLVLPGAAIGWFAVASYRSSPTRLVVNLFDANQTAQGTDTYLGAEPTDVGFYVQDAAGTFYTQDGRNPGAEPRILAFSGTGALAGSTWFACETSAAPNADFADLVVLVGASPAPVPVLHANWGALKRRFR